MKWSPKCLINITSHSYNCFSYQCEFLKSTLLVTFKCAAQYYNYSPHAVHYSPRTQYIITGSLTPCTHLASSPPHLPVSFSVSGFFPHLSSDRVPIIFHGRIVFQCVEHHNSLTSPHVDGHWGCFQCLWITAKSVAMTSFVNMLFCMCSTYSEV